MLLDNPQKNEKDVNYGTAIDLALQQVLFDAVGHLGRRSLYRHPTILRLWKEYPAFLKEEGGHDIISLPHVIAGLKRFYQMFYSKGKEKESILLVGCNVASCGTISYYGEKVGCKFIAYRWIPGLLTNRDVVRKMMVRNISANSTKKERMFFTKKLEKREVALKGVVGMTKPSLIFLSSVGANPVVVKEAKVMGIPVWAVADTSDDIRGLRDVIIGNSDSMVFMEIVVSCIAHAIIAGNTGDVNVYDAYYAWAEGYIDRSTEGGFEKEEVESIEDNKTDG